MTRNQTLQITAIACGFALTAGLPQSSSAQQVGDAYVSFNYATGEFRISPGHAVSGSNGIDSFAVEMDSAIGTLSTSVTDYYFPSGTWALFPPQTGAVAGNTFGSAIQTWSLPNVSGGGDSLNVLNLVIGSPWVTQTGGSTGSTGAAIAGTTAVFASTIAGYEGLPEFSFGIFGPTTLTESQALSALGAASQGAFATGSRSYTLQSLVGTQQFRVFAIPEPFGLSLAGAGCVMLRLLAVRSRRISRLRSPK